MTGELYRKAMRWMFHTPYRIAFENPFTRTDERYNKVNDAVKAAYEVLADKNGTLPPGIERVLFRVSEGGAGTEHGVYQGSLMGTHYIRLHMVDVDLMDQTSLNSVVLHELYHAVQRARGDPRKTFEDRVAIEADAWGLMKKFMNDPRFKPQPGLANDIAICTQDPALCTRP